MERKTAEAMVQITQFWVVVASIVVMTPSSDDPELTLNQSVVKHFRAVRVLSSGMTNAGTD